MVKTVLEVIELKTYFFTRRGVVKAVDGISFAVGEGETIGLVGESGCGKTISCLSILRLLPAPAGRIVSGKVLFDGEDLTQKSEAEMREIRGKRISMILQDPMTSLNPVFTIGNQVAEPFKIHQGLRGKEVWSSVINMLELVKIPSPEMRIRQYPHQMSGGMRQRIVGAIALSCQPELLIADEPTTSLDVTIQAQYLKLLKEVQSQLNTSLIFITHDFGVVAKMCDRVAVMYAGKIVESAEVREIFDSPFHPYTIGLLNSIPKSETRVNRLFSLEGQPPDLSKLLEGCRFAERCSRIENICRDQYPPQRMVGDGHFVNCWLATRAS